MRIKDKLANMGLREKLISIFVLIKVLPLVLLGLFAWEASQRLGDAVTERAIQMAEQMRDTQKATGKMATDDAIAALDERSREAIESLTTQTARAVAEFLYDRDADVLRAAQLAPSPASYQQFLNTHVRRLIEHGKYVPAADGKSWVPEQTAQNSTVTSATPLPDNAKGFHQRAPEDLGHSHHKPLYLEMTFVDPSGQEKVRVVDGKVMKPGLRNVSKPENTYVKAERYFAELKKLKPGEVYVSEVIGPQVPASWIGPNTPAKAKELNKPFEPEKSGYAGLENPVGQHFQGIVRWATPVVSGGAVTGYVTLALDHRHLAQFVNTIRPTDQRMAPIPDPGSGNYAFIWDFKGRSIVHPRDYFIVGYDPATGEQAVPWMDTDLWAEWKASGKSWTEFVKTIPEFRDQNLKRKPAPESSKSGSVGLDCRYLNFSPQCHGWFQVTEGGGSGSFTIFFSGLWKLTTAAAIPYYTGQYGQNKRGFGFVTIGANVDDFHRAATESGKRITAMIAASDEKIAESREGLVASIQQHLSYTASMLTGSTIVMVIVVIGIAIWMASILTRKITDMIRGIHAFEGGDLDKRLEVDGKDEMAQLAVSFNRMADSVSDSFRNLEQARSNAEEAQQVAEKANQMKTEFLQAMSHELRTPLNGIIGFADLLDMELEDEAQKEYVHTIRNSGDHLLRMVMDILDVAKAEVGELELTLQPLSASDMVQALGYQIQEAASAKGLSIQTECADNLPFLHGDQARLRQALGNILDNAIKFTHQGCITLRAALSEDGELVRFDVQDTGIGIAAEHLEAIFERFHQIDQSATRAHEGTGLGLALSRLLVENMGGKITVTSEPGVGSTFSVWMPRSEEMLEI